MRRLRRMLLRAAQAAAILVLCAAVGLGALVAYYGRGADDVDVERLRNWRPKVVTRIFARDGTEIGLLHFGERRTFVPLAEIPEHVVAAFLAAEDARFLEHGGFDPIGIARAVLANLLHAEVRQGASTITQQVIKQLLLSPERTLERKSQELWLAGRVERAVGKPRILEIYLNLVYLGEGRYGVEEAARHYFGASVREIGIAEAAILAALPKAPGKVTPFRAPERTWQRAKWVLARMAEEGFITEEIAASLADGPMPVRDPDATLPGVRHDLAPEVVEIVRAELIRRFGEEALPTLGAQVTTTLDPKLQETVRAAARTAASPHGAEAAVVLAEVETFAVRAHVGGIDPAPGMFDRVRRARRQPASTFKPVVYGAALDAGAVDASTLVPVDDAGGLATVRTALARSNNVAARFVMSQVGAEAVHAFARALGIVSPLHDHPSLALGTAEVTPLELLTAYGTIARTGRPFVPRWIERVEIDGAVVPPPAPAPAAAGISSTTAHRLAELLEAVVAEGTGRGASALGRPVAGKTGTSDEGRDVWFAGFSRDHVAVAWIGRDDASPLGDEATGARLALPVWREAMAAASAGWPSRPFEPPAGLVVRRMDRRTGGRACTLRDEWYAPPRCSGFWIFESCTPAGTRSAPRHLLCTDPRAVVPLSLPARAEPPPPLPAGWSRALGRTRVALLGVSLRGGADGEAPALPPDAEARLAPWLAWVDGRDRALRRASNVPAGAAVVRFEVAPDGRIANLRVPPGTDPTFAAVVRALLEGAPPPPPPEIARAGPDGTAHVRLGVVVPSREAG